MIYITAIHMTPPGTRHEHIAEVRWLNSTTGATGATSRAGAVDYLNQGNRMQVKTSTGAVEVGVVDASPPYIRTVANGVASDNLLSLPRY